MEGASRRHKRDFDLAITQAWHAVAFDRAKRLKKLSDYLGDAKPKRAQTPDEMLAVLMSMKGAGAPMNIRKVN
jgi:hypothetical protein